MHYLKLPVCCAVCREKFTAYEKINTEFIPSYDGLHVSVYYLCKLCKKKMEK